MSNSDVKNEKFGYAHELVGRLVEFEHPNGRQYAGRIVRYQEPVGTDTQSNIAVVDPVASDCERYNPLETTRFK